MERQTNSIISATSFWSWNSILSCHSLMGWMSLSNPSLMSNQESSAYLPVLLMTSCFASSSAFSLITASSNCCCFLNRWILKSLTSDSMSLKMAIPGSAMASKGAWIRLTNPLQYTRVNPIRMGLSIGVISHSRSPAAICQPMYPRYINAPNPPIALPTKAEPTAPSWTLLSNLVNTSMNHFSNAPSPFKNWSRLL